MRRFSLAVAAATLSLGLLPMSAFAASAVDSVSEEDVMNVLDTLPADGKGGGLDSSIYYPGPYGGGITIDANVTKEVTPDFVAVNGYCEASNFDSREEVRAELTKIFNAIKAAVGDDGRVRRSGTPSVYPFYDGYGTVPTNKFSGSINVFIRVTHTNAAQRIADVLDKYNCSPSWDVRMVDAEDYELGVLDDLLKRLNKRKAVFEKLLGKKLTKISGASISTYVDGWSSYDPETNKADAITTLTLTFDIAVGVRVPRSPMPLTKEAPKG